MIGAWKSALELDINISVLTKTLPTKGNLVYEYNPFRNYRLTRDMYEYQDKLYTEAELKEKFGFTFNLISGKWEKEGIPITEDITTRLKGELVDFITSELNFDLNHPVNIIPQYSYDGSVNLILNDGKNLPRLINSRFSATGKDTYEIVDRRGTNDTNIYDQGELFDVDTSLYKRVKQIPKLTLKSITSGGALQCGNYHFYFKLSDADGNETDFIAESGLVSIFIGSNFPQAIYSGNKNENAVKLIQFLLSNIDPSYSYVNVYYSRATAEDGENREVIYRRIERKFLVNNLLQSRILITGFDEETEITPEEINLAYNIVDASNCATTAQGMLFLGNVHKPNIPYEELEDLSLRFLPYLKDDNYELEIDENYNITSGKGYYDPIYIYNNTGYWNREIYRLGIVYILSNGELSPVFNIRGRENIEKFGKFIGNTKLNPDDKDPKTLAYDSQYSYFKFKIGELRVQIKANEDTHIIIPPTQNTDKPEESEGYAESTASFENNKGVITLNSDNDSRIVHAIEIRVENKTLEYLRKLGIKGYFFVRQSRMPTILAQGITIGVDKEGRVPTIPTKGGVLNELVSKLEGSTYVETLGIDGHNYISEGFLSRYTFDLKPKGSAIWSKIGAIAAIAAVTVACVAATVITAGGAGPLTAWIESAAVTSLASSLAAAAGVSAATVATVGASVAVGAAAAVVGSTVGAIAAATDEGIKALARTRRNVRELKGRNTEIHNGFKRVETDESRLLGSSFDSRIIIKDYTKNDVSGILCPDYDVAPQYYNQLFTGLEFTIKTSLSQAQSEYGSDAYQREIVNYYAFKNSGRHFYMPWKGYTSSTYNLHNYLCKLQSVPDDVACVTIGKTKFRSKAGNASEAWRYECIGTDYKQTPSSYSKAEENVEQSSDVAMLTDEEIKAEVKDKQINSDIVRGAYGPYLGMEGYSGLVGETVDIMIPGYSEALLGEYFQIRMLDSSPFYAISDRYDINNLEEYYLLNSALQGDVSKVEDCKFTVYRGDCFICQFTHRLNRNFNDDNSPYNSEIVDSKSWKDHYLVEKSEEFLKINLGDVNAVNLGMWITFTVRSNRNLNVRSLDGSIVAETAVMGHPRGFFPYHGMIAEGNYKSPEALVYNDGFAKNLSERFNFTLPDSPYIRNWYGTRIMYSDIHVNDGYKNGYRVFQGLNYRDYTREYGSITKLLNFGENLFVVFEHGLAIVPINERAVAADGTGGYAYINTSSVLPENPKIISESYGSLWPDSVIMTPQDGLLGAAIFGVDTVAKKIWMYSGGNGLQIISDFKVQEFLNLNLTLTEREKEPVLGIRNVKTVYNAFKHDVMFTFYDDLVGHEEKVWNLCYNLMLNKFITFYSWVPSFMENVNNIPFSFDRTISKWIAKLGQSHSDNSFAEGIVLSNNIYNNDGTVDSVPYINYKYLTKDGNYKVKKVSFANQTGLIGIFNLLDHVLPEGHNILTYVKFELMRDIYGYYKNFEIRKAGEITFTAEDKAKFENTIPVYGLYLSPQSNEVYTLPGNKVVGTESNKVSTGITENPLYYFTELYYRNAKGHDFNDYDDYKVTIEELDDLHCTLELDSDQKALLPEYKDDFKPNGEFFNITLNLKNYFNIVQKLNLPQFYSRNGCRPTLPESIYKNNLIQLLNIKATIYAKYTADEDNKNELSLAEYMNYIKSKDSENAEVIEELGWNNAGTYESSIAVTSKWNSQFLDTSFWKHGQAGVIDNVDPIQPTKWYGEQHPFEFEFIVVNDPGVHKIFLNLEIISNKAKPESFHFEVIGDAYDFAKDKPNMYFRQEARKALLQYNGCDISYDKGFRKINPRLQPKSAELVHYYYERQDTFEDIYDTYHLKQDTNLITVAPYYSSWAAQVPNKDYRHLSGGEIVYYPNRQEYRVWLHQPAIDIDDLPQDTASSIIRSNCQYLEDRWRVSINPLLICYKNEYVRRVSGVLCQPNNSTWPSAMTVSGTESKTKLPPITIRNTTLPNAVKEYVSKNNKSLYFPDETLGIGKDNALYGLYFWGNNNCPVDNTNWLNDLSIYKMNFGEALNRREADIRDKFVKVRIRYKGEELAVIDFLNTIYTISYA